jgi:hypothetical protein
MKKHQASSLSDSVPKERAVQELTEAEAARELRVSVATLQRDRAEGKIKFARRRRRIFYPVACIEEYRQSQVTRECPITSRTTSGSLKTARPGTTTLRGHLDDARLAARWARKINR